MKKSVLMLAATAAIGLSLTGCTANHTSRAGEASPTPTAAKLPASFPRKEVPLISGRILLATGDAENGWTVTVAPPKPGLDAAEKALEATGEYSIRKSTPTAITLVGHDYDVALDTPGTSVTYIVTEQDNHK